MSKWDKLYVICNMLSNIYRNSKSTSFEILYWLNCDLEDTVISSTQRLIISRVAFSKDKVMEMRELFVKLYENNDIILDYLNRKITKHYFFSHIKRPKDYKKTNDEVKKIFNDLNIFDIIDEK